MSVSDIIPGFSGGIALTITGKIKKVWATIDKIIKPDKKGNRLKGIIFYSFFILGSLLGVFAFSQVIRIMMIHIPAITFWFFLALTIGSIFIYAKHNKMKLSSLAKDKKTRKISKLGIITGFILIFTIVLTTFLLRGAFGLSDLRPSPGNSNELNKWSVRIMVFAAGFFGAASMVTPGVSGALVILMLGSYGYIYSDMYPFPGDHPFVLAIYMGCTLLGTLFSILVLNKLYKKYSHFMDWFFIGTIIASVIGMVWLFHSILIPAQTWRWAVIAVSFSLGVGLTVFIVRYLGNKERKSA